MKSWSLCKSNVPQLLDLAPNEAGNLNEVYERYVLPGQEKEEDIFCTFDPSIHKFTKLTTEFCLLLFSSIFNASMTYTSVLHSSPVLFLAPQFYIP